MNTSEDLTRGLPDPDSAGRFLRQLSEQHPSNFKKLQKKEGLLSDVLTLVSYSPLIATTLLQNPEYFWWLDRKRREKGVRTKEELLESLARFSLTNSQVQVRKPLLHLHKIISFPRKKRSTPLKIGRLP